MDGHFFMLKYGPINSAKRVSVKFRGERKGTDLKLIQRDPRIFQGDNKEFVRT